MKITVTRDDGSTYDITGPTQATYDAAIGSMDWGSGFLDQEEVALITALGHACGFTAPDRFGYGGDDAKEALTFAERAVQKWEDRRAKDPNAQFKAPTA